MQFFLSLSRIPEILQWIRQQLILSEFSASFLRNIELVCEELLVNIFYHAYQQQEAIVEIKVIAASNKQAALMFIDSGPFFDISSISFANVHTSSLEEMPQGGMGLKLIHSLVNRIAYKREGSSNVVQVTFQELIAKSC